MSAFPVSDFARSIPQCAISVTVNVLFCLQKEKTQRKKGLEMKKLVSAILAVVLVLALSAAAYADYGIVVNRNPVGGTWAEGESAWFDVSAQYYSTLDWTFVDPCGGEHSVQEFRAIFPDVVVVGEDTTMLTVGNLSSELNGWAVFCSFHSDIDNAKTSWAFFTVTDRVPAYSVNPYYGY